MNRGLTTGLDMEGRAFPLAYNLSMNVSMEQLQYSGQVEIALIVNRGSRSLFLNYSGPHLGRIGVSCQGSALPMQHTAWTNGLIHLVFPKELEPGQVYTAHLGFSGNIQSNTTHGFYASGQVDSPGFVAVTQFETNGASTVFPCFDEPDLKATFSIQLTVDSHYEAVSNMPYKVEKIGPRSLYSFHRTPLMSTYLLAWVIHKFHSTSIQQKNEPIIRFFYENAEQKLIAA